MKTSILILLAAAALPAFSFADSLQPTLISNGHGQFAYRAPSATSVALFVSGRSVSTNDPAAVSLKSESKSNGHGQSVVLYRAVR